MKTKFTFWQKLYMYVIKRFFDFITALIFVLVFSPLYLILMLTGAICLKGNPFFCQKRPGKHGKAFALVKFRSMSNKKDKDGNLLPDNERLGKYGKFIRKTSLDEIPEFFSVLVGKLSLVGPRPLDMSYLPYFTEEENRRHDVTPGITGWAQVNGRTAIDWDTKLKSDVYYVDHISLWMDIKCLFLTVKTVLDFNEVVAAEEQGDFDDYRRNQLKEKEKEGK